ncbi:MAG: hypothetical protein OXT69_14210 [Candidatus Poribacteria bacterium]|nr:hypothetical protein [Candidatus Poribacteria bacterium]
MRHRATTMFRASNRIGLLTTAAIAATAFFAASSVHAGMWVDDFEDSVMEDWQIYNPDPTVKSWEEKDGVMTGQINVDGFTTLHLKPEGEDTSVWSNYTVRARLRLNSDPQPGGSTSFGFAVYDRIEETMYHLCLLQYQDENVLLYIRIGNGIGFETFPMAFEPNVWYDLAVRIETDGDTETIIFRVDDGDTIGLTWQASIGSGGVGLLVEGGQVSFDNFSIEGDNIPDGGHMAQTSVSPAGRAAQVWGEIKRQ